MNKINQGIILFKMNRSLLSDYFLQNSSICSFRSSDSWVVLSPIELSIKQKIEAIGTPLKDWDIQINYGIKTGFNEAFIIDGEKRAELIEADPKCAEIIRPILRGRDIKRYAYEFADLWLIYIPWHFPLYNDPSIQGVSLEAEALFKYEYPTIYRHLYQYKKQLSARNQAETGVRYEWYALQRYGSNYMDDFNKQKIVWIELTDHPNFALDEKGYYINNTVFFMTGENLKYILAFLNSKICEWYFDKICATSGVGTRRWIKMYIDQICIPVIDDKTCSDIVYLVDHKTSIEDYEFQINNRFAAICNLNISEIEWIEKCKL